MARSSLLENPRYRDRRPRGENLERRWANHALEHQLHARHSECPERLAGNAFHFEVQRGVFVMQYMPNQFPGQARTEGAVLVSDGFLDRKG